MPKKPTTPFGHIAFGKDGSVRPQFERLPDSKAEQEEGVAQRFARDGGGFLPQGASLQMLDESDNDSTFRTRQGGYMQLFKPQK